MKSGGLPFQAGRTLYVQRSWGQARVRSVQGMSKRPV